MRWLRHSSESTTVDTNPHELPVQLESHMDDKEFDLFGDVWF